MRRMLCGSVLFMITFTMTWAQSPASRPLTAKSPTAESSRSNITVFEAESFAIAETQIDKFVFAKLEKLAIPPANPCSDAVFIRRVYLDVIGTLPTAQETRDFLADSNPKKRSIIIDRLLERPEFADYTSMRWADILRVKAEFPINLWPAAVESYHRWIHTSLKENKPYDKFVRELLTASGSNFRVPEVNFYRGMQMKDPAGIAQAVALTFMGTRTESWPKDQAAGMAEFFSQLGFKSTKEWKEEIVFWDPMHTSASTQPATLPAPATIPAAVFPDGARAKLAADRDPRIDFADWLVNPKNPWFTRCIANRTWYWLMGRGIVHEPDDIRPDNAPSNPELLKYLEQELIAAKYDVKALYRLILNSRAYQLSCVPKSTRPEAAANFASFPLRRLEAEVLADALCQITGTTEKYSSPIPEPFTFIPENQRSILLADGSTTSSFLELFGRPPRDTGWESERNNKVTPAQRLHLINSTHIQRKIEQGRGMQALVQPKASVKDPVAEIYLAILSRLPTAEERKLTEPKLQSGNRREVLTDLAWALINSTEFIYRH